MSGLINVGKIPLIRDSGARNSEPEAPFASQL